VKFSPKEIAFQNIWQSFSLKSRNLWQNIHFQFLCGNFSENSATQQIIALFPCWLPWYFVSFLRLDQRYKTSFVVPMKIKCTGGSLLESHTLLVETALYAITISVLFCSDFSLGGDLFPKIILCRIFLWNISYVGPFTSLRKKADIQLMYVPPQLSHG
jgi:hypothetical protein